MSINIRLESENDHKAVEELTREAFWNLYAPGADEHLLVHKLRKHSDFIPELDFVAVKDDKVIGNIMYSKSCVVYDSRNSFETITFGPVSVLPEFHRQGVGSALINHSIKIASTLEYKAIIIYGYPAYYYRFGFRPAKDFGIYNSEGKYPFAHQVLELYDGSLNGISGKAYESSVFNIDVAELELFEKNFSPKTKLVTPSQDEFTIAADTYL